MPLIVMEPRSGGNEKDRMKKIEAPPNSFFRLGSKVECFGKTWLVTEVNYNEELKLQGVMRLCNFLLIWQHPRTFEIHKEWCVCSKYKTTASGEDSGETVSINSTRRYITIQLNKSTVSLRQQMRHYIDINLEDIVDFDIDIDDLEDSLKTYKMTDLDRTTGVVNGRGVFYLTYDEDQKQEYDRPDLGLCDYKEVPDPITPSIGYCEITYSGESVIKVGAPSKRFTVVFKDNDGVPITTITPTWQLIGNPDVINKIVISLQVGNEIRLESEDNDLIGESFVLKVVGNDLIYGYFECEQTVLIDLLW